MPTPPFIVIKLRAGWALVGDGRSVAWYGHRSTVDLPRGARFVPALRLPPVADEDATPAETELARYVHLQLATDMTAQQAVALAGTWTFVESARLPPAD